METLLAVRDLHVRYAEAAVLRGVDLELGRGEIVGLTGRSGSGKSTLALAILQALPPQAKVTGSMKFTGSRMAPVFQEATGALHPLLRVGTQITEALRARRDPGQGRRKSLAIAALESAGLSAKHFAAWPHELSGGQKQRALIAQAIVGEPDLIVADEPTASLDPETQTAVLLTLRELQRARGMAMLLISHSPAVLRSLAGRVLEMRDGVVVDEVLND